MQELTIQQEDPSVRVFVSERIKRMVFVVKNKYVVLICLHCGGATAPFYTFCSPSEAQFPFVKICECVPQNFG